MADFPAVGVDEYTLGFQLLVDYADKLNKMTFDECLRDLKERGIDYLDPNESDTVGSEIYASDEYRDMVFMIDIFFTPNENGVPTLSMICYGDFDYFEVSITDSHHEKPVEYHIHDTNRDYYHENADSVEQLLAFINDAVSYYYD